jgi:hypothetical protein
MEKVYGAFVGHGFLIRRFKRRQIFEFHERVLNSSILIMSSSIELINPKAESVRRAAALQVFVLSLR